MVEFTLILKALERASQRYSILRSNGGRVRVRVDLIHDVIVSDRELSLEFKRLYGGIPSPGYIKYVLYELLKSLGVDLREASTGSVLVNLVRERMGVVGV